MLQQGGSESGGAVSTLAWHPKNKHKHASRDLQRGMPAAQAADDSEGWVTNRPSALLRWGSHQHLSQSRGAAAHRQQRLGRTARITCNWTGSWQQRLGAVEDTSIMPGKTDPWLGNKHYSLLTYRMQYSRSKSLKNLSGLSSGHDRPTVLGRDQLL